MNGVLCSGLESRLLDCRYDSATDADYHAEDAGVHCQLRKLRIISILHFLVL